VRNVKLEDILKQKNFKNAREKVVVNLVYTHSWLQPLLRQIFSEFGLTQAQYNVLRILRGQYPESASILLIQERMIFKQSDVSRLVDRLLAKGLVKRKTCGLDRRKMDVLITKKGHEILDDIETPLTERQYQITRNLDDDEILTLNSLLDKLRNEGAQ